jgi:2-C-methyl-D-erythritol 4-phosphate cytidylyltransferase
MDHAVDAARATAAGVVVVVPADVKWSWPGVVAVTGGATRSASVRAGLAAVPEDADIVVVHDAARPLAAPALFSAVIGAVRDGADGAVPGLPVADTVKQVEGDVVVATPPRETLVAAQTPQAFRASALRRAHLGGAEGTDDAAVVETAGGRVVVVAGEPDNFKITRPADLVRAERILTERGESM